MKIETKIEKFNEHLYLESGRLLESFQIIYETYGELNEDKSNVIIICHALSCLIASIPILFKAITQGLVYAVHAIAM